jgi:hypothetical protein
MDTAGLDTIVIRRARRTGDARHDHDNQCLTESCLVTEGPKISGLSTDSYLMIIKCLLEGILQSSAYLLCSSQSLSAFRRLEVCL